jgi:dienelactone hydrolase
MFFDRRRWRFSIIVLGAAVVLLGSYGTALGANARSVARSFSGWRAYSPWIGGQSAYDRGEYVYQGYLYDDEGAAGVSTTDEYNGSKQFGLLSQPSGTFRYPQDPARYGANAANLLQIRFALAGRYLKMQIRLNTLLVRNSTVATVAFGTAGQSRKHPWPFAAGISTPSRTALTVWGTGGALTNLATGRTRSIASAGGAVAVNLKQMAIQATIPIRTLPAQKLRIYAATGLWDPGTHSYMAIGGIHRTTTTPGGALPGQPRLWDVAFRPHEVPSYPTHQEYWFEDDQAQALAARNISQFSAMLSLRRMREHFTAHPTIPRGRVVEAIFHSSVTAGGGKGVSEAGLSGPGAGVLQATSYNFLGHYQPYALYVPPDLHKPAPVVLVLHGGSANMVSVINEPGFQQDIADSHGRILASPLARGPASQYTGPAEVDVLDSLADVERRFAVDPNRVYMTGYSMGGYGTYRMVTRHPALFAAAIVWSGNPGESGQANGYPEEILENARDVPIYIQQNVEDALVPYNTVLPIADRLNALGYEYRFDTHPVGEHLTFALLDSWTNEDAWLADHVRDPSPRHVVWKRAVGWDEPQVSPKVVVKGAYWVNDLEPRDQGTGASSLTSYAKVAATSLALPGTDAPTVPYRSAGTQASPYVTLGRRAAAPSPGPRSNALQLALTNTSLLTISLPAAELSTRRPLHLTLSSDGPTTIRLTGRQPAAVKLVGAITNPHGMTARLQKRELIIELPSAGSFTAAISPG